MRDPIHRVMRSLRKRASELRLILYQPRGGKRHASITPSSIRRTRVSCEQRAIRAATVTLIVSDEITPRSFGTVSGSCFAPPFFVGRRRPEKHLRHRPARNSGITCPRLNQCASHAPGGQGDSTDCTGCVAGFASRHRIRECSSMSQKPLLVRRAWSVPTSHSSSTSSNEMLRARATAPTVNCL